MKNTLIIIIAICLVLITIALLYGADAARGAVDFSLRILAYPLGILLAMIIWMLVIGFIVVVCVITFYVVSAIPDWVWTAVGTLIAGLFSLLWIFLIKIVWSGETIKQPEQSEAVYQLGRFGLVILSLAMLYGTAEFWLRHIW